MFRRIVLLLAFLAVINALDPLTNAIDPLTNARDRLRSAPPSPSAIDPLNGCTMIGLTDDPATTLKGINIMAIDTSGTCYSPDTKFIVPCNLVIEPLIVTTIQVNSSSQTSTTDYTYDDNSRVSFEAHGGFGPFTVNARFTEGSSDYVHTITSNTVTYVSTIAEMQLYQITAPFLSMPLSAEFTDYVNILADKYESRDLAGYNYYLNLFIQNTPIAVITRIITGGRLQQTQYVDDSYYQSTDKSVVAGCASASANFAGMFSATGQYSWGVTIEEIQTFVGKVSQVTTTAVGGPYVAGMTLEQWQTAAEQTPGILEYWLSSTSNYIDPIFFPQRNSTTIQYVKSTYENPWIAYLNNNSKFGCTDKFAVNFHLDSTVDDGTCVYDYQTTSSFAGLYMIEVYTDDSGTSTKYYDNPFTNAPACPTGSFAICQSFSDWVDLTICTCEGGSNPAFGGVFSTGANNDFFNIDSANNVVTGATSCATGTSALPINGINICAGNNATSWTYGGAYYYNGDGCTPNPQTNQCTCPDASYAVVSIGVEVQSQWGSINLCVTLPSQQTNPNPGSYPNYVAMKVSNVTWVIPTQTPTTPSPTTPFPTTQLPIPPRPTSPPPPSSMSPPDWIYPVILGVGILVILVGGMVAIYFRCRPQAEYTPIQ